MWAAGGAGVPGIPGDADMVSGPCRDLPIIVKSVNSEGGLLRLGGTYDVRTTLLLEAALSELAPRLRGAPPLHQSAVRLGAVVAVSENGNFVRAAITSVYPLRVRSMDSWGERDVALEELRPLNDAPELIRGAPPQHIELVVARVAHPRGAWEPETLSYLSDLLLDKEVMYKIEFMGDNRRFAGVRFDNCDLSEFLIYHNVGVAADVKQQIKMLRTSFQARPVIDLQERTDRRAPALLQTKFARNVAVPRPLNRQEDSPKSSTSPTSAGPLAYNGPPLEVESKHRVHVSYARDGPELFAVQLESDEEKLISIMKEISSQPLKNITEPPIIGTVCLGKFSEDGTVCRAVVTGLADNKCRLYFVDFGMTELVSSYDIYHIPKNLVAPRVLAFRFCLSGIKKMTVDEDLKQVFHTLVHNKVLTLRVTAPEDPPLVQYCELFLNGHNIRDILKSNDPSTLQFESIPTSNIAGRLKVIVSFVDSCTKFFVQLAEYSEKLNEVMDLVDQHCTNATSLQFHEIKNGMPCCAMYPDDRKWYRALVTNIKKDKITVNYVDYGNDQELTADNIKPITRALLLLPIQALHCALKGYEDKPFSAKLSSQLEELTVETELIMNVCGTLGAKILLVDLINDKTVPSANISDQLKQFESQELFTSPQEVNSSFSSDNSVKQSNFETPSNTQYKKHREENTYSSGGSSYDKKKFRNKSSMDDRLKFNEEPENSNFSDNYNSQRQDFDSKPDNDYRKKRENVKKNFHPPQRKKEKDEANNGSSSLTSYPPKRNNFKGHSEKKRNTSSDFVKQNHRWNGSDRNFRSQGKKFNSPKSNSYSQDHSYKSSSTTKVLNNPAPYDASFKEFVPNSTIDVRVSWIVNPDQFYVQILSLWNDFEAMMDRIPIIYEGIKPSMDMISAGSCVLALFPEDNSVYRAEVLENKGFDSYLVFFVDFGNTCIVQCNHVWPLDNELLELPKMALKCSLKGVSPVEKEWSVDNQEDKYFNGSLYRCEFISKYLDSYVVTLTDESGSTVKDNLINDNMAVAGDSKFIPKYEGENLELSMLVGQNIYAQICHVEAMTKFYVCVDPFVESFDNNVSDILSTNKPVECALHNFDPESSQLSMNESDFKSLENHYILIYVDEVCDKKLLVTLYDQKTGFKIECFTPDDGAYESIPLICPHPVFSKDFGSAYTTHVESINEIYLQRDKNSGLISSLLELLYTFYSVQGNCHDLENAEVDAICAAKSHDENWYRAKIVEIHPEECKVQYIDYGNSETVSKTYIKKLDSQFYQFYEQAVVCGLGVEALENVVVDELRNQIENQELNVTLALDDIGWVSNILVNGKNVSQNINKTELSESIVIEEKSSKPVSAVKPKNEPISALVSHIDSPGQFWLQLTSETDKLDELGSKIQAEVQNLEDLTTCDIGKTCIAKYSADEQYYRAVILDSDSDIITVRFTDYGNTDVLDNAPGILKCLPENLAVIKPYVIKCSVNAFPASMGEWTEPATSLFTQLIGDKEKPVEAITILVDSTTYVNIHVNGINITQKLVEAGYAVLNDKQDDGELLTCFTSHINSPSEFWVHLESSVSDLELVSEQLIDAENFAPITEIEEEVICAAKFPEDDNWYRAKIIIHGSDGTEVLFMDYGNASLTDELRNLPEKLKNMPALSRKCALQKPANIKSWSKEAELKFTELAAEGATVFHISFVATGDISIVELYLNNKSITEQLISLCDTSGTTGEETIDKNKILPTVHMTCSNGPNDFWIQYNSYADQLNTVMNALMDAEDFDTLEDKLVGSLCVSLFSDDNMWYRSSIISVNADEIKVVHIDYGLTATTSTLKRIPEELINIPPLAKNCCLALPDNCDKFNLNDNKAFAKISAKQSQIYYIEIVDSSKEPEIVNLYIKQNEEFVNILKQLKDKKVDDLSRDVPVSQNIANSSVAEKTMTDIQNVVTEDSKSIIESQNVIVESNISNSSDILVSPDVENSSVAEKTMTDPQNIVIEDSNSVIESQNVIVESNISNSSDILVSPDIENSSVAEKTMTDAQNIVIEDSNSIIESQNVIVESNISNSSDILVSPDIENSFVAEKATTDIKNVIEDLNNITETQNVPFESNISSSSNVNSESSNTDGIDDFDSDVKGSEKIADEKTTMNSNEPEVLNIQNGESAQIVSENILEESNKSVSDSNSSDSQLELSPSQTNITKSEDIHKDDVEVPKLSAEEKETLNATDSSVSEDSCNLSIEKQSFEIENSKDISDDSNSTNKEEENNSQSVTEIQNMIESTDSVTEIKNNVESTDSVTEIKNIVDSTDSVTIHSNDILSNNDDKVKDTDTNLIKPKITVTDENDDIVNDNIDMKKKHDSSKEKIDGAVEKVDGEGVVSVE